MIKSQSAFHSTKLLCRALNVSTSAYYAWATCRPSKRHLENATLRQSIKEYFVTSRQTYGVPRLQRVMKQNGQHHGKARISRIMKQEGLQSKAAKRFKVTTNSQHTKPVAKNLLNRQFNPGCMNKAWVADITYIQTTDGWLYLATVLDLHNRQIVGWSMGCRLVTALIEDALTMAIQRYKPTQGIIHHSDRGSQYCSTSYQHLLKKHGVVCSMSGSGNCYDNAVMESFYHTLKIELLYGEPLHSREETKLMIFDYIEVFYNRQRLHSALGYQTPEAFALAA
jgi:transposase InsO family protein